MLNNLLAYFKANKRKIKKHFRTDYTRPIKDKVHDKVIDIRIAYLKTRLFISQLHNLRLLGMFIVMFWFFRDFAFAADPKVTDFTSIMIDFLNFWIWVMTFCIWPLVMLAWWLLSPDWTYWEIFWMRNVFHALWVTIWNIVYVAFAFILIYIAFVNIFSEKKSSFQISQALPRLIVGILIVPFSWFLVSWVTSVASVLTASVIRLPIETINTSVWWDPTHFINQPIIPKSIIYDQKSTNTATWTVTQGTGTGALKISWKLSATDCDQDKAGCVSIMSILTWPKWSVFNLLSAYAYWIFKLPETQKIDATQVDSLNTIFDLLLKWWFSIIFFLVFWVLLLAIIFALFSRMGKLWLYIIFSPLFGLAYFFKSEGKLWKELEKFSIMWMISLAMVPVYVAAALSFWLVFLSAVQSNSPSSTAGTLVSDVVIINDKGGTEQDFVFWEVTFTTKWLLSKWTVSTWNWVLATWKWILGTIIINFLALWVLWFAVMAALWANEITKTAVAPFEKMWKDVWWLIKDAPKYAPIPTPMWKMSAAWMENYTRNIKSEVDSRALWDSGAKWREFGDYLSNKIWLPLSDVSKSVWNLNDAMKTASYKNAIQNNATADIKDNAYKAFVWAAWVDAATAIKQPQIKEKLIEGAREIYGITDEKKLNELKSAKTIDEFDAAFKKAIADKRTTIQRDNISDFIWTWTTAEAPKVLPKVEKVEHSIVEKTSWTPAEIRLKLEGTTEHKIIPLSNAAEIATGKAIIISPEDKSALAWIIQEMDPKKASDLLKSMFTWVDDSKIAELLTEIKKA
ncbi:MAG: hypothetical protein ACD_2C00256G0006 [uncultured bacterium (gcode 4)]|uniref:Uncharacterized protein n=1 Tax=uncultured bacterium (gcode 4) TaxID=1234023 RepID=K2GFA7_9BACT|nr:MAG: hypothetical protein ACD_2C00256G0006 [uncultured bacterium (gcode 4)]